MINGLNQKILYGKISYLKVPTCKKAIKLLNYRMIEYFFVNLKVQKEIYYEGCCI